MFSGKKLRENGGDEDACSEHCKGIENEKDTVSPVRGPVGERPKRKS